MLADSLEETDARLASRHNPRGQGPEQARVSSAELLSVLRCQFQCLDTLLYLLLHHGQDSLGLSQAI